MKTNFYAQRPLSIGNAELEVGELLATVETPGSVPVEKALHAIESGQATPEKRKPTKAEAAAAEAAAGGEKK